MRIERKRFFLTLFTIIFILLLAIALSHLVYGRSEEQLGGEKEGGPSISDSVGVELSDVAQKSIGLKVVEADMRVIENVLIINGIVKPDPNRVAEVSTRIEGRIERLYATLGDWVQKGQKLVDIQSRQLGNPPPVVTVTAPISGTVVERSVVLGEAVEPNKHLFHIVDLSKVIVEGDVFESDVSKVKLGQDARIRLDAYPDKIFTGKAIFVASELDPVKRTLHIWVSVDNKEGLFKPELFARVALVVKSGREVLTIPVEAIIDDGAEKFVFVKNGNQFVRQDVATGVSDDRYVEITDGLYPGDQVVTDGNRQIYTKWLLGGGLEERE
ncbi:MAG: efflux RND transporter periplasmic adaptor subunit [Thermodesulfobacteriota bacterium]